MEAIIHVEDAGFSISFIDRTLQTIHAKHCLYYD
jgi:hypothetical protein